MTKDEVFWVAAGFGALCFCWQVITQLVGDYLDNRRERLWLERLDAREERR